ncbi:amino acid permease [Agromyces rhizosphaerae]|uniref:Amino acid permease n=1 Tax=Agromyces rhizosphaerae TaxID=88374 RepID=A0A9W6FPN4_9MICO|nr:APC family permease [Agromyces rhizosphaerae]GLI27706.1 amino acid permease [Agromyces rhizosphaerae]
MSALERAIANPEPVRGLDAESPVAGLDRRSVGAVEVFAQSVSAVAPTGAALTTPAIIASVTGTASLLPTLLAAGVTLLVASAITQFSRRMAAPGGVSAYIARGLGSTSALVGGVAQLIGYGFVAMFALVGTVYTTLSLVDFTWPSFAAPPVLAVALMLVFGAGALFILVRGIRRSARVTLIVEVVSVGLLAVLTVALLGVLWATDAPMMANRTFAVFDPTAISGPELLVTTAIAMTAFVGFESASTLGGEAKRPLLAIPRAIVWTVFVSTGLYLLTGYAQLTGIDAADLRGGGGYFPIDGVTASLGVPWLGAVLEVAIAASLFACLIASATAMTRVLFALAREGLLPRALGRTRRRSGTPIVSVALGMSIVVAVPVVSVLLGAALWPTMQWLLLGAATGYLVAYFLVSVASPVFLWRIGESGWRSTLVAVSGAVGVAAILVAYLVVEATGARSGAVWLMVGILGVTIVLAAVRTVFAFRHPRIRGVYDVPTIADVWGGRRGEP